MAIFSLLETLLSFGLEADYTNQIEIHCRTLYIVVSISLCLVPTLLHFISHCASEAGLWMALWANITELLAVGCCVSYHLNQY